MHESRKGGISSSCECIHRKEAIGMHLCRKGEYFDSMYLRLREEFSNGMYLETEDTSTQCVS